MFKVYFYFVIALLYLVLSINAGNIPNMVFIDNTIFVLIVVLRLV